MSQVKVSGNASGTGTLTLAAPNTNSDYTLTLPTATTTLVGTDATQTLTNKTLGSGSVLTTLPTVTTYSSVQVSVTNGKGSTNTSVYRWTNVLLNTGTDITYADSASLGGTFTINTTGMYALSLTIDANTNGATFGITNATTGADASYYVNALSTSANYPNTMATTVVLSAGAIIYAYGGSPVGTNNARSRFTISRVA